MIRDHILWGGGHLRTTEGFIRTKAVRDFNRKHKIDDKRYTEITPDRFNMHLNVKDVKNKDDIEDAEEDRRIAAAEKKRADEAKAKDKTGDAAEDE